VIPVARPLLGGEEAAAAAETIVSGWVAQGPRVAEFEAAFAALVGAPHAVAVSSCTAGLHLAMIVLGLGPGDEVVVPSLSFIATANAVRYVGATPVFADVDEATQNLTPETIAGALTRATRAVILVHQAGAPADLTGVRGLCAERGLALVEDAACAIGSTHRGQPVGHGSDLAVFSFHPRKVITTGEGGMVTTTRADWADRLRRLREHGMSVSAAERHRSRQPVFERYLETGFNFRMTDVQAAIGLVQLRRLDAIVSRRRLLASRYHALLGRIPGLVMAADPPDGTTNYQSFWVLPPPGFPARRDELMRVLTERGVSPRRGIMAAHLEPAYAGAARAPLPVTERLAAGSLILPLFHELTRAEQELVAGVVLEAAGCPTPPVR
jgi:perosamine synthetase